MRLCDALRVQRGDVVSFIGAGGKTSALLRLADELRGDGWRVLVTTTTRLATHEIKRVPCARQIKAQTQAAEIRAWLDEYGCVFLYSRHDKAQRKIIGLHPEQIAGLMDSVNSDVLLIEADGARRLPLKAPYDHEPVIPPDVSLVVPVAGLDALGQPLDDAHVYNAARIQARYGFPDGGTIIPPWMAVTLRDPELGLRGVPDKARVVILLNKLGTHPYDRRRARRVAQLALHSTRIDAVAIGAMQAVGEPVCEVQRRVAAVVLAAGRSSRMGQSKVLLPWAGGRSVIETIVARLALARLSDVVVVSGHRAGDVARKLKRSPTRTVHNPDYARGEMLSSLQTGLNALPDTVSACLVVMGDQPALDARVIGKVMAAYAAGRGDIVMPVHRGTRGHPVLIDRRFWPELLAQEEGTPRVVLARHPRDIALVKVNTDSILRDIDTPEQYRRERFRAGLR
ncbi:MAG: putative selenium-dependent hydroxylase accessory protein YqeC [Anaerolineae bacterium]|nr:putative selenium-dependent hydroxylase accessory protein YqeC [Anaerolineae bacterium]